MHEIDLQRHQRQEARWRILRVLDSGRPIKSSETLIGSVLHDLDLPISPSQIRRELRYLAGKGLVTLFKTSEPTWMAELTSEGIDVVEYTADCPAGIARPQQYW